MRKDVVIAKDVIDFMDHCSCEVGKWNKNNHDYELYQNILNYEITSPIEQILWCALNTIIIFNSIPLAEPEYMENIKKEIYRGIKIDTQEKIGNYRVDFMVSFHGFDWKIKEQTLRQVIIECDSQQWHERTELERRYEKTRDRYMQSIGYNVFHYTGKEIKDNTMDVAAEIISYVTNESIDNIMKDSNIND